MTLGTFRALTKRLPDTTQIVNENDDERDLVLRITEEVLGTRRGAPPNSEEDTYSILYTLSIREA